MCLKKHKHNKKFNKIELDVDENKNESDVDENFNSFSQSSLPESPNDESDQLVQTLGFEINKNKILQTNTQKYSNIINNKSNINSPNQQQISKKILPIVFKKQQQSKPQNKNLNPKDVVSTNLSPEEIEVIKFLRIKKKEKEIIDNEQKKEIEKKRNLIPKYTIEEIDLANGIHKRVQKIRTNFDISKVFLIKCPEDNQLLNQSCSDLKKNEDNVNYLKKN